LFYNVNRIHEHKLLLILSQQFPKVASEANLLSGVTPKQMLYKIPK